MQRKEMATKAAAKRKQEMLRNMILLKESPPKTTYGSVVFVKYLKKSEEGIISAYPNYYLEIYLKVWVGMYSDLTQVI